jgi:hypothetical protein
VDYSKHLQSMFDLNASYEEAKRGYLVSKGFRTRLHFFCELHGVKRPQTVLSRKTRQGAMNDLTLWLEESGAVLLTPLRSVRLESLTESGE